MKTLKKMSVYLVVVLVVALFTIPALAADTTVYQSHMEITAGVTGRSLEDIRADLRNTNTTCLTLVTDAGKLAEYKTEELRMIGQRLDYDVADGYLTRAEADAILEDVKADQANYGSYAKGDYSLRSDRYGYGHGYGCSYQSHRYTSQTTPSTNRTTTSRPYNTGRGYGSGYGHGHGHGGGHGCRW